VRRPRTAPVRRDPDVLSGPDAEAAHAAMMATLNRRLKPASLVTPQGEPALTSDGPLRATREPVVTAPQGNAGESPASINGGSGERIVEVALPDGAGVTAVSKPSPCASVLHWQLSEDKWFLTSTSGQYVVRKRCVEPSNAHSAAIHTYTAYRLTPGGETVLGASSDARGAKELARQDWEKRA